MEPLSWTLYPTILSRVSAVYIITIIVLISTLTGALATPNNENGFMFEHSSSIALIDNQPKPNGLTGAFCWVHIETVRTFFGLLDIRNVLENFFNGISDFIEVLTNGEGITYQRRLSSSESYNYEAIIHKIKADHERELSSLPDSHLYLTESIMETYIASHQDPLPSVLTHPNVPAAPFSSPEIGSTCFIRPAICCPMNRSWGINSGPMRSCVLPQDPRRR